MGELVALAAIVTSTIATVVATIAAVIASAVVFIATAIWAMIGIVASTIVGGVVGILNGLGLVSWVTAVETLATVGALNNVALTVAFTLSGWVASAVSVFAAFAEAIHLAAILKIHQIAMLVSEDYRLMMNKIYASISEVSSALGQGAQFLNLTFRNARAIVLDASTSLGKRYDLAEVGWLYNFNDIMKTVQEKAEVYERAPHELFNDLDRMIIKPAMDAKAEAQLIIFTNIEAMLSRTKEVVENLVSYRNRLEEFIHDLPHFLQKRIAPEFDKAIKVFDDFVSDTYGPALKALDDIVDVIVDRQSQAVKSMGGILERMKRPGDLLLVVDELDVEDRADQEKKIGEVATRTIRKVNEQLTEASQSTMAGLIKVRAALKRSVELVPWEVGEMEGPSRKPIAEIEPLGTWFVGDY